MSTGYRIKDVAERSGFSAATLRYHEEIGLLPESVRTPSGYRTYDDRTLERLAFIARAKQLGCSLDEIAELAVAWDGGSCGPVQDRLRVAVADKLATAQRQIAALTVLTAELHRAAESLQVHRPDGPCDDTCGCVTSTSAGEPSAPAAVSPSLGRKHARPEPPPVACTLDADSMRGRLEDWHCLLAHVEVREPIDDGVRSVFASSVPLAELIHLVAAEHGCCPFMTFTITVDARGLALEVTAPADAQPVVHALFGVPT